MTKNRELGLLLSKVHIERLLEAIACLRELDATGVPLAEAGVSIICGNRHWISGNPYLYSSNYKRAFAFAGEGSARRFIDDFGDVLDAPHVVERGTE
jgi:hypothetical protein